MPAPVTDAPKRRQPAQTLRPLPGKDYSGYSADPLPTARACALLNVLSAAGAADPLGMARALTGRDITQAEQLSEREGMQLLHILQARAAQVQASAPAPTPQALSSRQAPSVPLATATPCPRPTQAPKSRSNSASMSSPRRTRKPAGSGRRRSQ